MRHKKLGGLVALLLACSSAYAGFWSKPDEALIEKAWACGAGNKALVVSTSQKPSEIFKFSKCPDLSDDDKNKLGEALLDKYAEDAGVGYQRLNKFAAEKSDRENRQQQKEREEEMARAELARQEAEKQRAEKEAQKTARLSDTAKQQALVEKAWSCEPKLTKRVSINAEVAMDIAPSDIFTFAKCDELSDQERNELGQALYDQYASTPNRLGRDVSLVRFARESEQRRIKRWYADRDEQAKQRDAEKKASAEAARQEQQQRAAKLRSGEVKIADIKDAWLAQNKVSNLMQLMASPLVKPNNAIYGARVVLDAEEGKGVLRAKWDSDTADSVLDSPLEEPNEASLTVGMMSRSQYGGSVLYVQLNQSRKTVAFSDNMRFGQSVWVIGRYVGNRKFMRANRTEGTMPVLEVLYIGE